MDKLLEAINAKLRGDRRRGNCVIQVHDGRNEVEIVSPLNLGTKKKLLSSLTLSPTCHCPKRWLVLLLSCKLTNVVLHANLFCGFVVCTTLALLRSSAIIPVVPFCPATTNGYGGNKTRESKSRFVEMRYCNRMILFFKVSIVILLCKVHRTRFDSCVVVSLNIKPPLPRRL